MTMTPRKEEFAKLLASEKPIPFIEAYEKAGYSVKRNKDGKPAPHIYLNASRLASEDDIVSRIEEIRNIREKKQNAVTLYKKEDEEGTGS